MKRALLLILVLTLYLTSSIACSPAKQVVRTEYIKQEIPSIPPEPAYYPIIWRAVEGGYFLDELSARDLLKNIAIMRAYEREMREILQRLKEGK
jgi:hypothetical protein